MRNFMFVMSLLFLTTHPLDCWSQTAGGISGSSPVGSIVFPASPTTDDLIGFRLTADGMTHGNQCEQLRAFGGADFEIIVDEPSRSILIAVRGTHPGFCPRNLTPVNGLEGSVGPLAAGDWAIKTSFPGVSLPSEPFSFTVAQAPALLGDSNSDGVVNCDDIDSYRPQLNTSATDATAALDLASSGTIDLDDVEHLITNLVVTQPNGLTGTFLGDLNCDGQVDVLEDAFTLVSNLNSSVDSYSQGDINLDGNVNILDDAFIFVSNLGLSNTNP